MELEDLKSFVQGRAISLRADIQTFEDEAQKMIEEVKNDLVMNTLTIMNQRLAAIEKKLAEADEDLKDEG